MLTARALEQCSARRDSADLHTRSPEDVPRPTADLVGRDEELGFCTAALERRDGGGVIVTGAAGVGKTRLALVLLDVAAKFGYATERVIATTAGRQIPLGPFLRLLPEEIETPPTPYELLRSIRTAILPRGRDRPLALLVDDAHLLDPASATLVEQLAATREATLLATVRTGEPLLDAIVALWKEHGFAYVELQPLSREETAALVESLVAGQADGATKQRLWSATRGSPLFVRELVQHGLERGHLVQDRGLWRWRGPLHPGRRLLALIGSRFGRLDQRQREVLELVALGEPLSYGALGVDEAAAADALTRRGVLCAERDGRRMHLRLGHPLYGESVLAGLPDPRVAALQARLADVLQTGGLKRRGDLLRFARLRLESGGEASPEAFTRAAEEAAGSAAAELAERLARAAVERGGGVLAHKALARAMIEQKRFAEADEILTSLARDAQSEEEATYVAMARARNLIVGFGRSDDADRALVEAAKTVRNVRLGLELAGARAWVLAWRGHVSKAAEAWIALVNDDAADADFRVRACAPAANALELAGRAEEALALLAELRPLLDRAEDLEGRRLPMSTIRGACREAEVLALLHAGRIAEADSAATEAYALFVEGLPTESMAFCRGLVTLVQGRLDDATRLFREAADYGAEHDPVGHRPWLLAYAAQALAQAGDTVEAREQLAEAARTRLPGPLLYDPDLLLAEAWVSASDGLLTEAQDLAREASAVAEARGALTSAFLAAHDLVRLGDSVGGASLLASFSTLMQGTLVVACREHAEAAVAGDGHRLEAAAAGFADKGALLWAAEAESSAAAAYRAAGRHASARASSARAAALLERCGGARTPALALAGPVQDLTSREREVATLVAGGATNREIAARLLVSVRTVENHLQRVYRKLGVSSRRDLRRHLEPTE